MIFLYPKSNFNLIKISTQKRRIGVFLFDDSNYTVLFFWSSKIIVFYFLSIFLSLLYNFKERENIVGNSQDVFSLSNLSVSHDVYH